MNSKLNRRKFIVGAGGAALSLPVLPSLLTRGEAQIAKPPLRLVLVTNDSSVFEKNFFPQDIGMNALGAEIYQKRLSDIQGPLSPILGSAFDGLRNKLSVLRGLDHIGFGGHNRTIFSCGVSSYDPNIPNFSNPGGIPLHRGASIDALLQKSPNFYNFTPKEKALRISVYNDFKFSFDRNPDGSIIELDYLRDNASAYGYMFSGVSPTGGTENTDRTRRLMTVDKVLERVNALLSHKRIGALDKKRLQAHLESMNTLQRNISSYMPRSCNPPVQEFQEFSNPNPLKMYTNFVDTIVNAFNCDLTRIATLVIADCDDNTHVNYHALSHQPLADEPSLTEHARLSSWIANRVADLMNKMDRIIEADGSTMLDNSIVIWGQETAEHHANESLPLLVGGSAAGRITTGNYLDYRQRPFKSILDQTEIPSVGRPYTNFLISVMRALGLQPEEFMGYGDGGGFGQFIPDPVYGRGEYDKFRSERNNTLPFFYKG
jgi:hypothetical protein